MDQKTLRWIKKQWQGRRACLLLLSVGNGLTAVAALGFALACRAVIDAGGTPRLYRWGVLLLGVVLLYLLLRLGCRALDEYLRAKLGVDLRAGVFRQVYLKTYPALAAYHSGELLNRLFSDVSVVVDGVVGILPAAVNLGVRMVGALGLLIWMKQWALLLFLLGGMVFIGILMLFKRRFKVLHQQAQCAEGRMRAFFQEGIENRLMVKCFGVEAVMEAQAAEHQQTFMKVHLKRRWLLVASGSAMDFLFNLSYCFALLVGAFMLSGSKAGMTYGTLMVTLQLVGQIQIPFTSLSGLLPRYFTTLASAERLMALEDLPDEARAIGEKSDAVFKEIAIEAVSFGYSPEAPVLCDVTLRLDAGERIALRGVSGGGKTTLFLLLMGIYPPDQGRIQVTMADGVRPGGAWMRGLFAWVPQGNFLLSGTLRENLCLLNREASEEAVWQALRTACAEDFVRRLPKGLETVVGERGVGLSEGQIQRIAIARAVLSPGTVLLLDEATSALDESTEAEVLGHLKALNRTCIIVTHRHRALEICTRHLRLEKGRLIEDEG